MLQGAVRGALKVLCGCWQCLFCDTVSLRRVLFSVLVKVLPVSCARGAAVRSGWRCLFGDAVRMLVRVLLTSPNFRGLCWCIFLGV